MSRLLTLCLLPTLLVATLAGAAQPYKRSVLANGLVVTAVQDTSSPIAAVHFGVRVASGEGRESVAGVGALAQQIAQGRLEALLKEEAWKPLWVETQARAVIGLNTETDYCEGRAQVTAENLGLVLKALATVLFDRAAVSAEEVARARGVLAQSAARTAENAVEASYYQLLRAYFGPASPLARPVTGSPEELESLTAADVDAFRTSLAGPNNATVCVIGPQPCDELIALTAAAVADRPAAKTTVRWTAAPPSRLPRVAVATLADWRGGSVMLGVPVGAYGSRSFVVGQLIYVMLSGRQGRLRQATSVEGAGGNNRIFGNDDDDGPVSAIPPVPGPRPFLATHMVAQPRQIEDARQTMLGCLLSFDRTPPTAQELDRAKAQLLNASAVSRLSHLATAKAINSYELCGAEVGEAWRLPEYLKDITPAAVQALAHQWVEQHAVGVVLPGEGVD